MIWPFSKKKPLKGDEWVKAKGGKLRKWIPKRRTYYVPCPKVGKEIHYNECPGCIHYIGTDLGGEKGPSAGGIYCTFPKLPKIVKEDKEFERNLEETRAKQKLIKYTRKEGKNYFLNCPKIEKEIDSNECWRCKYKSGWVLAKEGGIYCTY
jgi:hypothetical protein